MDDDRRIAAGAGGAGPIARGEAVALAVAPGVGAGLATAAWRTALPAHSWAAEIASLDAATRPRWVMWSSATAAALVAAGVRVATSWDVAAVHRLVHGGWAADPALAWARAKGLDPADAPAGGPLDLFTQLDRDAGDADDPVRPDGYLRPEWVAGSWARDGERLAGWAAAALEVAARQADGLPGPDPARVGATARVESAAELLCTELAADGLPMDREEAEAILAGLIGPRPASAADAAAVRATRDDAVLRHLPPGVEVDLRSPAQIKALLGRLGIDVSDTRAWRLRTMDDDPLIAALLRWRKAERMATTYHYGWLDDRLGADGRLRGSWSSADGAAGRMTATAGLHNMPADLRPAVRAEPGYTFVRADLGQIEPRVLAAVSGDADLAAATAAEDLYAPVAAQLGVDRPTAKVAVLGAMYGQTTGHGAQALHRLHRAYPVAMAYLDEADRRARAGEDLRTRGGRLISMSGPDPSTTAAEAATRAAARGRYGRNALVQGAAAELFKMWAVTVRARAAAAGAAIVLCLHDELLVHAPLAVAADVAGLVDDCLQEAARRWAPEGSVRFLADTEIVPRWSDAKAPPPAP